MLPAGSRPAENTERLWYGRPTEVATTDAARRTPTPRLRSSRARAAIDVALIAALGAIVLHVALWPTEIHGYPFPVGPDVPVYLWWARVGAAGGISLVGERPGTPALIPTIASALGVGIVPALAGIQYAMGPAIALAAAALVRGRGAVARGAWLAAAILSAAWATFLGGGYLGNLVFAAAFLAAAVALARRTRRGAFAAALLLGGGGLAHPEFFTIGMLVLLVTAAWSWSRDRRVSLGTDAGRVLAAAAGGAALVVGGILVSLAGPARLAGDTSIDAMQRRTGQLDALRRNYLDRLVQNWRRYAPFMTTALAVAGMFRAGGFTRRFLVSWALVTVVMLPVGIITGVFPPDRILMFAFCLPALAGFGLVWIGERLGRWWLAWPAGIVLVTLIVLPALRDWRAQRTYLSPAEVADVTLAGRIAATTPQGTPLVFVTDSPDTQVALFELSHLFNVARAALPPERAGDVYSFLGRPQDLLDGRPSVRGNPEYDIASADSLAQIPPGPRAVFVVGEVNDPAALSATGLTRWDAELASSVPDPRPLPAGAGELRASDPSTITRATIRTFLLLLIVGAGWAWWTTGDAAGGFAIAPAFGAAVLTLTALALERLGADLQRGSIAVVACAVAGGAGYALLAVRLLERRRRRRLVLEREARLHA